MTVLVLGGAGFIGPRVIRKLVERGESVYATDINPLPHIPGIDNDAVRSARVDITDFEQVTRAIVEAQPDRIINLAYLLGGGEGNPHHQMRLNILGMDNCFEAGRLLGVNRIVYASSVAVSGQQSNFGDRAATEDDPHLRRQPVRRPQDFQRIPGQNVQRKLRNVHHGHPSGQCHRPGQGARLHRPCALHNPAGAGRTRQLPPPGYDAPAHPC